MKRFQQLKQSIITNEWVLFTFRTFSYAIIIIALIYLYHYKRVGGGGFIYNQF